MEKFNPNGCWWKDSKIPVPYAIMFEACCNKHDELYYKWGNEIDRKIADIYLLEYMKFDIKNIVFYKRPYFYIWAYLYYFSVRFFWKKYFIYRAKKLW